MLRRIILQDTDIKPTIQKSSNNSRVLGLVPYYMIVHVVLYRPDREFRSPPELFRQSDLYWW